MLFDQLFSIAYSPLVSLKIGYITDERYPSVHTDTQQVIKTADALGASGCTVELIQPRMAKHLFMNRERRKQEICRYFNVAGQFEIRDILLWPASDLRVEKLFHGIASPLKAAFKKYDLVYTRNLIPLIVASRLSLPVLFETYRALPQCDARAWRVVESAAKGSRFIGISTHSEYTRKVMCEAGIDPELVETIPNGFDPRDFEGSPPQMDARREVGLPEDRRLAVYAGQIRKEKGIDSLLDLAEDCTQYQMVIVGGVPSDIEYVRQQIKERSLENVSLEGQVPISRVPYYLAAADVLVLPPTLRPLLNAGRTVLPMKVFSYLAGGRPIMAPDLPDTEGVLNHESNCLKVEPDNRRSAALAMARLADEPELAARLSEQALLDSKQYTWQSRAKRLIEFFERRLKKVPR